MKLLARRGMEAKFITSIDPSFNSTKTFQNTVSQFKINVQVNLGCKNEGTEKTSIDFGYRKDSEA
jgi:hypothetical protein